MGKSGPFSPLRLFISPIWAKSGQPTDKMRALSLAGIQSLLAESTNDVWVFGLEVFDPMNPGDTNYAERFCANTEDLVFQDRIYYALPFELTLAQDEEDTAPKVRLRVDNIHRQIVQAIRETNLQPQIVIRLFRVRTTYTQQGEKVNTVEVEMTASMYLVSATATADTVECILGAKNDILNEPATHGRFTFALCPGMFN